MKKGPLSRSRETCYFSRAGETHVPVVSSGSRTPGAHDGVSPGRERLNSLPDRREYKSLPYGREMKSLPYGRRSKSLPTGREGPFFIQNAFENTKPIGKRLIQIMFES